MFHLVFRIFIKIKLYIHTHTHTHTHIYINISHIYIATQIPKQCQMKEKKKTTMASLTLYNLCEL